MTPTGPCSQAFVWLEQVVMGSPSTHPEALIPVLDDHDESGSLTPTKHHDDQRIWALIALLSLAFISSIIILYVVLQGDRLNRLITPIFQIVQDNPILGLFLFITLYTFNAVIIIAISLKTYWCLIQVLCLPVFPLMLGIGFVSVSTYGIFPGIPLGCLQVIFAASIASSIIYIIGRNACRSQVAVLARRSKIIHVEELLMKHKGHDHLFTINLNHIK